MSDRCFKEYFRAPIGFFSSEGTVHLNNLRKCDVKKGEAGFTLIELLVVIAIIGILAAVAVPFYQGYMLKAKLTEVVNAMSIIKSAVSSYHQDSEGSWPNCTTIDDIQNSLGVGLGSISRISDISIVDGAIITTVDNIGLLVDGKTLSLIPSDDGDGSIRWTWSYSADFPIHLVPKGN